MTIIEWCERLFTQQRCIRDGRLLLKTPMSKYLQGFISTGVAIEPLTVVRI